MKVLVVNCGSSSLKYQLITTGDGAVIARGIVEKIGEKSPEHGWTRRSGEKVRESVSAGTHTEALKTVLVNLTRPDNGFLGSLPEIDAIGHRVVHGGEEFTGSALIDERVIASIEKYSELAPLHNPPNLQGIRACLEVLPETRQVAVFDTAFHHSIPERSFLYAIPYEYYKKYGIRRYGFHGTSHRYVAMKAAEFLKIPSERFNAVTCHLGNGSSVTAVRNGKSADTSMGFTPLEGVVMGTRCGTIDPAIIFYLMEKENLSTAQMNSILQKKSGLLGLSGVSNDLRDINAAAESGNDRARIAVECLVHSVRKAIGQYLVELGRVDAVVFTAGIGENEWHVRRDCVAGLENLGIELDADKNRSARGTLADLSAPGSRTRVLCVPTNEELMIALETQWVLNNV